MLLYLDQGWQHKAVQDHKLLFLVKLRSFTLRFPLRFYQIVVHRVYVLQFYKVCVCMMCKHASMTVSVVHKLGSHKICLEQILTFHSTVHVQLGPPIRPSAQRPGPPGTAIRKCPSTGYYCTLNIMRSSLHPTQRALSWIIKFCSILADTTPGFILWGKEMSLD